MINIKDIWNKLSSKYSEDIRFTGELWTEIHIAYSSSKRHYHTLSHLKYMIDKALRFKNKITDFDTLLFSIFYHDFVYNIKQQDNEQKSADIAKDRLTKLDVPFEKVTKCSNQILSTKDHKAFNDNDTKYLLAIDIAIFYSNPLSAV